MKQIYFDLSPYLQNSWEDETDLLWFVPLSAEQLRRWNMIYFDLSPYPIYRTVEKMKQIYFDLSPYLQNSWEDETDLLWFVPPYFCRSVGEMRQIYFAIQFSDIKKMLIFFALCFETICFFLFATYPDNYIAVNPFPEIAIAKHKKNLTLSLLKVIKSYHLCY